ncbi:catalase [Paeniglutamicibacter antarcticus]|uniref:Catalase n=1 Tax=Arthrobacter terrae TaxID=2935737 RepID=A0A931CI71_9MICC|nr:catalase [Arthrobacter terrae]MBG0739057.1 catalase [Arthrobacter terrae]
MSSSKKPIPGAPAAQPPQVPEQTVPHSPLPPKSDQRGPEMVSPTGVPTGAPAGSASQSGAYLTTAQGLRLSDTDHSLKAGTRGPTLLQDHHLREKITHFDHERIPERVVHARGAGAHGIFQSYGTGTRITRAGFLAKDVQTPVFVRFSTVAGSRGSADTVRDTRGFATKFYTDEGTFDLVGNNIPVFFIQDGIKFPDVVHSVKPHPDREIPQAQSAHDTFWDFVSLHTEAQAHTVWFMADRGIPRSFRTMEGFGVHTFRLVNADDQTSLVKFHWKPRLGVHSLVWEEALMINGVDPDFHRRDLANAIEAGAFPAWELGVQVFPDTDDEMFEGIDLLDPTKFIPEELAPVQPLGLMTLNANPKNYFAETEQVAFHPGHLVPGIDITNDPLLQARMFSYLDTQISRLGGPNFAQIPINRPQAPVNDMLRDGMHQSADYAGVAPYRPNSLDGGCPFHAGSQDGAFIDIPQPVAEGVKIRDAAATFDDHYSQATLFYRSLSTVEQSHVIEAYTFELGKCYETAIRERQLKSLANIDAGLCSGVAAGLGLPVPEPEQQPGNPQPSPAVSQVGRKWPTDGRVIGIVTDSGTDADKVLTARDAITAAGMVPLVIAPTGGMLTDTDEPVQRSYATAHSTEFDALLLATSETGEPVDPRILLMVTETFRHAKAIGGWGSAAAVLAAGAIDLSAAGLVLGEPEDVVTRVGELLTEHRVWKRFSA